MLSAPELDARRLALELAAVDERNRTGSVATSAVVLDRAELYAKFLLGTAATPAPASSTKIRLRRS
jgi:hypothetical protein